MAPGKLFLHPATEGIISFVAEPSDFVTELQITLATSIKKSITGAAQPHLIRIVARQILGAQTLTAVASRSVLGVSLHERSNLLAADTALITSADTFLDQLAPTTARGALVRMNFSHIDPTAQNTLLMQFDVGSFAGLLWKTVKLKLTFESAGGGTPPTIPNLSRVLQAVVISRATWNKFATGGAETDWAIAGATGAADRDVPSIVAWTAYPSSPYANAQVITSTDITTLVNDAIALNNGTLFLLVDGPIAAFTVQRFVSIEGAADITRPHLFFDAF